jgi:SPP1 gp7 family putative phage head morphogenesis protein
MSASSDVVDFEAAIAWFRSRVPLTDEQMAQIDDEVRQRAFTVAGVAQLDVVTQVFDSIEAALASGTDLDDFKSAVADQLSSAWGEDDGWRVETIFRTNVQSSYTAGRYHQATAAATDRPYWMFDAILDGRTTEVCEKCDGTVRPADDPWWKSHLPPLHFNCRSHFVTMTEEQAGAHGVTRAPTSAEPDDGFGAPPTFGTPGWEPQKKDYPTALWKIADVAPPPPAGLKEGEQVKKVTTTKGAPVDEAFQAIKSPDVLKALEKKPISLVAFKPQVKYKGESTNGLYTTDGQTHTLSVTVDRTPKTFGNAFEPGKAWSVSYSGTDAKNAAVRTFVHELGHHVHMTVLKGTPADQTIKKAFESKNSKPITRYATTDRYEYFAESFAAYRFHPDELRAHDPIGYSMVEYVLGLLS